MLHFRKVKVVDIDRLAARTIGGCVQPHQNAKQERDRETKYRRFNRQMVNGCSPWNIRGRDSRHIKNMRSAMKMISRTIVAILALGLLAQCSGHAATVQQLRIPAYGPFATSCGTWTAARTAATRVEYVLWVEGFLTGAGTVLARQKIPVATTDSNGIEAWLTTYCAGHPIDSIDVAAETLVLELAERAKQR
jgi:hypothetical protein